jgi:hypothetical protein
MRRLVGLWERWLAVLRRREPGEALALFRIITGLSLLLNLLPAIRLGLVRVLWMDVSSGGYRGLDGAGSWLVRALGGPTPEVVGGLVAATLAAGLLVMIGLGGRWPALVAGQGMLAISMINNDAKGSYDALLCDSLWILFLAGGTATLSLDCRRRCGRWWAPSSVAAWPRYLAILQIAAVYGSTGLHKVSAFWTPMGGYSALYYILQQPTWHRWEMSALAWVFPLTQAATAVTWCWEVFWPLLPLQMILRAKQEATGRAPGRLGRLLTRWDLRWPFLGFGVAMHVSIFALMEVGPFSWITLAYYPCLLRSEELRAIGRRLRGWRAARRGRAVAETSVA